MKLDQFGNQSRVCRARMGTRVIRASKAAKWKADSVEELAIIAITMGPTMFPRPREVRYAPIDAPLAEKSVASTASIGPKAIREPLAKPDTNINGRNDSRLLA